MPCEPLDSDQFEPGSAPGISGFGIQLPNLNIPFPDIDLNDLKELFDRLAMFLPSGTMRPNFEPDFLNDIYGAIDDLLKKFFPFLMLYKFILPILNLILCIIEIICSLMHPIKLIRAIKRLFRICIPEFLSLFPFFALILMIISLLLLILELILYLINRLLRIIKTLLRNILLLAKATKRLSNDSIIGIVKKIGNLLCHLQNLFIIFALINTIIQIIKAILNLRFRIPPCDSTDSSDDGCCTPDVCPAFLRDNEEITSSNGNLLYFNEVGTDSGLPLPLGFPPIVSVVRPESWQFYDPSLSQSQAFINIIQAFDLPPEVGNITFFPPGITYDSTTNYSATPYSITFRLFYDPTIWGRSDPKGSRFIKIKNVVIARPPSFGVSSYTGTSTTGPFTGTLNLVGGVILEDDNTPIFDSGGNPFNINNFFHLPINSTGPTPLSTDGILFKDITYTFSIHHEILVLNNLITLGCVPSVAQDRDFINSTLGAQFNINGIKLAELVLPDTDAARDCIASAVIKYRQKISPETTQIFQDECLACLNQLREDTIKALTAAIGAGFDQYKSNFSLDPIIQFTTKSIKVIVALNESSGTSMTTNVPADAASSIADQISASINFGSISKFIYDGSQFFVADLTSEIPGNGSIQIAFNNNFISILNNPSSIDDIPSVLIKTLNYTFVESPAIDRGEPRRDDGDVSREGV